MNEDRATRYHRLKRRASLASLAWGVAMLVGLLASGLSVQLRHAAASWAHRLAPPSGEFLATVLAYVALLLLASEIGGLPIGFYSGFMLEHRYGLSTERLSAWIRDQVKAFAVGLPMAWGAASIIYGLIRFSPDAWWIFAGVVFL